MRHPISKTYFSLVLLSLVISLAGISTSHGATLRWDENSEEDLQGYRVYFGTSSGNYNSFIDVGNVAECALDDLYLEEHEIYYIAITAYDKSGNESAFSIELDFFADDGIPEGEDNCPGHYNPGQKDTYPPGGNEIGDACDCETNFDGDQDVDVEDLLIFIANYPRNKFNRPCTNTDPCNGDFSCDGAVDAWDIVKFLEDFGRNRFNNPCPGYTQELWCVYD
jgi:hypothetical protein